MLELEPEKRYRSADDITDELQRQLIRDGGIYGRFQAARHLGEVLPSGSEPTQQGGTDIIAVASGPSLAEPVEVEEPTRFGEVPAVEQSRRFARPIQKPMEKIGKTLRPIDGM